MEQILPLVRSSVDTSSGSTVFGSTAAAQPLVAMPLVAERHTDQLSSRSILL